MGTMGRWAHIMYFRDASEILQRCIRDEHASICFNDQVVARRQSVGNEWGDEQVSYHSSPHFTHTHAACGMRTHLVRGGCKACTSPPNTSSAHSCAHQALSAHPHTSSTHRSTLALRVAGSRACASPLNTSSAHSRAPCRHPWLTLAPTLPTPHPHISCMSYAHPP